ncbi:hypothetical protein [Aneurinibacillus aneurinilyticus]|uniref:Dephospho-CoA kinase n=1 Tax=Aneurinibacillus aneurinilyticus TaxID=1391 RepID=A0A848D2U9_ANEAE|nr:hypothetical protein [Aneurinibacillus aneurinilyticus]NMF00021.1 hypothetical protein [Aneurinibacillus aneurinilyticus]
MTIKLALTGKARSGKDAIAEYLVANYGFKRFAFGDGIREVCRQLYPEQFEGGAKPRALLQGVGQSLRAFDEDVWVKRTIYDINTEIFSNATVMGDRVLSSARIVVSDLRQPNEEKTLRSEGFVIIRVTAPEDLRIQRMITAGDAFNPDDLTHDTESYVDSFEVDYEITNDGTLDKLHAQVDEFMAELLADRQR